MEGTAEITLWQYLERLDQDITLAINAIHSPFSDTVWKIFSDKEIWYPMYLIVAVLIFVRLGWKKGLVSTLMIILTIVACDQFANLVKDTAERLRPYWDEYMLDNGLRRLEHNGNWYGFFSAHAANAMGFAVGSLMAFRNDTPRKYRVWGIFIISWALLVGISRIFVGKHFFGDVLVGFTVGACFAALLAMAGRVIIKKLNL